MKFSFLLPVFLAASSLAFCPLGFPPEQACAEESPSCVLFADADGNRICDNPEAVTAEQEEEESEEPSHSDSVSVQEELPVEQPDTAVTEPDPETEPAVPQIDEQEDPLVQTEELVEDPTQLDSVAIELVPCPLGYSPSEACPADDPGCALFRDPDWNSSCDNPLFLATERPVIDPDSLVVVTTTDIDCPLGFTPEEACPPEDRKCILFLDADESGFCDNPDSVGVVLLEINGWRNIGCPLNLDPEFACHHSLPLCPHWYGVTEGANCSAPLGGTRRIWTVFISLAILLPVSRILSRKLRGRRIKERMGRQKAHTIIRAVSLIVLGVGVQGCYCPLGTFQYLFLPGGLVFLGVLGVLILLLPVVQSMFCGRVFCAWVCPMGGLQEFLYRIHVPGQFSPSGRLHKLLLWLKYIILLGLVAWLIFGSSGKAGQWEALFCRFDPFRTVFTLFVSGSLVIAGVMIILAIFVRRFFCRYLCFYGALLSIFNRAHLLTRFRKRPVPPAEVPEEDSDAEFDR
jgi:hypothetical protein